MGVRIAHDSGNDVATLYCSTSCWAFGPIFEGAEAQEQCQAFLDWLSEHPKPGRALLGRDGTDARHYDDDALSLLYSLWREDALDEDGRLKEQVEA